MTGMLELCAPVVSPATVAALLPVVDALAATMDADADVAQALDRSGWQAHQVALGHIIDLLCSTELCITVDGVDYVVGGAGAG